ncbi:MAG: penicillin-binding protein activator LpoB [Treponema sp.]|jgi:TolB-like protein|nr:penicillin-binding protein activator LpoB [Treponema sp.]
MKRILFYIPALCALGLLLSCHSVKRVDADTQIDLSGYWNDTDLRLASDALIKDCLGVPRLSQFDLSQGRPPVIIVGNFKNGSDEHIDTTILSQRLEASILSSGKAEFVASGELREAIRGERRDQQQGYTDDATVAAMGKEAGADFIMTGSVKTIVDRYSKTATRSYFITAELTDITTNRRIWIGEYNEIKKVIKNPQVKP